MDQVKVVKNFISKDEINSMIEYIDHLETKNLKEFGIYQEGKRLALQFGNDLYHKTLSHLTLDLVFEKEKQIREYGGKNLHFKYSAILYLNELESGGELSFLDFGYSYKPQAGDLVVFPTFGTGIHAVLEIPETRYSMPFWMTSDKTFDLLK
jgi:hypothetical protein